MPTPQNPQHQPVINRPDTTPDWHWPIDSHTQMVDGNAIPGRRPAQYIPPVAGARIRQTRLTHNNLSAQFAPMPLVQDLRAAISKWQTYGYPSATATICRLLRYWQDDDERETPLYFAQMDAVLSHIYLHEAADRASFCHRLDDINRQRNRSIPRVAHKMATGAGKTLVMAMLIVWQTANHLADPANPDYTPYFLCLTPGIAVRQRLEQALNPARGAKSDYDRFRIVPPELEHVLGYASVTIANFHRLEPPPDPNALSNARANASSPAAAGHKRPPAVRRPNPPPTSSNDSLARARKATSTSSTKKDTTAIRATPTPLPGNPPYGSPAYANCTKPDDCSKSPTCRQRPSTWLSPILAFSSGLSANTACWTPWKPASPKYRCSPP